MNTDSVVTEALVTREGSVSGVSKRLVVTFGHKSGSISSYFTTAGAKASVIIRRFPKPDVYVACLCVWGILCV